MKRIIMSVLSCGIQILLCAEQIGRFTVIPVYGIAQQPQALAFVQRIRDAAHAGSGTMCASLIGDIEHPRSRDAERSAPHEHQQEMQKVRMGEQVCYTKRDNNGGEMQVTKIDRLEQNQLLHLDEKGTEDLKALIKRTLCRYYDESSGNNLVVAILKNNTVFDEVARNFIDCRAVIGLSSRMPRAPHIAHIILDQDVSLDDFLKEARSNIEDAYRRRVKEINDKMPQTEPARSMYQRTTASIRQRLKLDVNRALITIDDAQELLRRGHQPVFVAYQRDSIV